MLVPTKIAVGVAKPRAQGQATTSNAIASFKLNSTGEVSTIISPIDIDIELDTVIKTESQILVPIKYQKQKVRVAIAITP